MLKYVFYIGLLLYGNAVFSQENKSRDSLTTHIDEVVVTGTLKAMSRKDSPIPVEVYTKDFFQKNPSPNLLESVGMLNGVKPQLNCNICNTGDIHINGMEGAYTLVLIDGMPIVSGLSSVYGLSGIPMSMVERIEVVKGPAASLYGSEAMGGIINVITKSASKAANITVGMNATSWKEYNTDIGIKKDFNKIQSLLGINYFNYNQRIDHNQDGFTDVALQNRISLFNKWNLKRKEYKEASIAMRYVYEDRWGGQTQWDKKWRGSDSIYGESIYTNRWELIGKYQLPTQERIFAQFSYNIHHQDSYYGTTPYKAHQQIGFSQLYWDKELSKKHQLLSGISIRYNYYDDNTPATEISQKNSPSQYLMPGLFLQDNWKINEYNNLLLGYRLDYQQHHGFIHSPRIAYKFSKNRQHSFRTSFGTGFRVVNIFTEDHAALTGARDVIIKENLHPEKSYNGNLNYTGKFIHDNFFGEIDILAFYTHFTNKIVADYETHPQEIIYDNLQGYAISKGVAVNATINFLFPLKLTAGATYMRVFQNEKGEKSQQLFAPEWSGNFIADYRFPKNYTIDFTCKYYGPMRLPVLPHDYRPEYSPWFALMNLQLTKSFKNNITLYAGVKNILDFVPQNPIMRPEDPFNKNINDPVRNPYHYSFDPSYNYASLQGRRFFIGCRYQWE